MKHLEIKQMLKGILNEQENNWVSKERELFTVNKLLELDWLSDGTYLLEDKNFVKKLKECYFGYEHNEITTKDMAHKYYVIHEPFGNKSAPDYLFITPIGIFGVEDKSSKNGKISWNTGTPGENKIITYFDKKEKKVYLLTNEEYGWTKEIAEEYSTFKEEERKRSKENFKNRFKNRGGAFEKLGYYARPMLTDKNFIKELHDPSELNVDKILKCYLWENQNNQNMGNLTLELTSVN